MLPNSTPLTPLSANANSNCPASAPPPGSPSRLSQKPVFPATTSKLKHNMSFSPASFSQSIPSAHSSRIGSPAKSDKSGAGSLHDGIGDDSMCSNFSDFTVGQFGIAMDNSENTVPAPLSRKTSVKPSRPQTPITAKRPRSITETPRTARPKSRPNVRSSPPSSPSTPLAKRPEQTPNLMDFTQQFDRIVRPNGQNTPMHRREASSPSKRSPTKTNLPPATPTESRFFNLLDFSPAPMATPGSIPSITPREVEDLKAGFASQMMQIKAQLDGREVEVKGLRTAIQETEDRYAKLSNDLKMQENKLQDERNEWQKVKCEMGELFEIEKAEKESMAEILAEKEQVVNNLHAKLEAKDGEITRLGKRLRDVEDELERSREEVIRLKADKSPPPGATSTVQDANTNTQAEVERVARELHALYKAKHETKVAALKKSYEGRWEKKVTSLTEKVESLTKQNEELQHELEEKRTEEFTADMSFTAPSTDDEIRRELRETKALLEAERTEKEGIVSLVEELLSIQASSPPEQVEEKMRGSVRRASGAHVLRGGSSGLRNGIERMGMGASSRREPAPRTD